MSLLLGPTEIAGLTLKNRVVLSPMCMYEVKQEDGILTPFHFAHYGARALAGVGLMIIEATAVEPDGRISKHDLGLWNDGQKIELSKLVDTLHSFGAKVGIQLSHAGRKAEDAIYPLAPSAIPFNEHSKSPNEMTKEEIKKIQTAFAQAAKRAQDAGVDMIELHGAHGYLINEFLSPLTNKRTDEYGGSLENRYRFLKETIEQVRVFYKGSLWVRLSLTAYAPANEQNSIEDWQTIGRWLEQDSINCLDISTGGILDRRPDFPVYSGYQVPFSVAMKEAVSIPVTAVGLLDNAGLCEYLLQTNQVDLILQGRALLRNTSWLADAARELHDTEFKVYNHSYERGQKK